MNAVEGLTLIMLLIQIAAYVAIYRQKVVNERHQRRLRDLKRQRGPE